MKKVTISNRTSGPLQVPAPFNMMLPRGKTVPVALSEQDIEAAKSSAFIKRLTRAQSLSVSYGDEAAAPEAAEPAPLEHTLRENENAPKPQQPEAQQLPQEERWQREARGPLRAQPEPEPVEETPAPEPMPPSMRSQEHLFPDTDEGEMPPPAPPEDVDDDLLDDEQFASDEGAVITDEGSVPDEGSPQPEGGEPVRKKAASTKKKKRR